MSAEHSEIEKGMTVYGSDGETLGKVSRVWIDSEETPASREGDVPAKRTYVEMEEGGFLGIGETHLYFPFDAVETVVPGESVTVRCGKEECLHDYADKPDFIKKKEAIAATASTTGAGGAVVVVINH